MKKFLFLTSFAVMFLVFCKSTKAQDHFSTKIGKEVNGKITIVTDKKEMMTKWQNLLKNAKIEVVFSDLEIIKEEGFYLLIATSKDKKVKSAMELVLDNGNLYQAKVNTGGGFGGITVTCTGCTVGCTPRKIIEGIWECKYPCPQCVKSETVTELK